uniref:Uncharacterized protein n=1 Tax=Cacopsylla melanoneura TaxID=428564 RepID=A0A8D8SEX3_9HEMI
MVYKTRSGKPQVHYGKKFFYKYRLDKLYEALKGVNLATASAEQLKEALAAIEAFFGKIIFFKPNHEAWVKVHKAFSDLDNGVVEVVRRLEFCLRYSQEKNPFECLISPPMQHKWYSKVSKNATEEDPQRGHQVPSRFSKNGSQKERQSIQTQVPLKNTDPSRFPKNDGSQKECQSLVPLKNTDMTSVDGLARTLGDLEITKDSVPFRKESSRNLVSAYHANLGWLFQEMSRGCVWFKKSTFEEEMNLEWVPPPSSGP